MLVSVIIALAIALYFAPGLVAVLCGHPKAVGIIILNLVLGWTLIGWVMSFIWACRQPEADSADAAVAKRLLVVEIEDLVRMKQRGQLTEKEYAKRRKMLLERYGG